MTEEEILSYNEMCAKFLNADLYHFGGSDEYHLYDVLEFIDDGLDEKHYYAVEEMLFHSDWKWIMEVVDAIETKFLKYTLQWEYDDREEFAEDGKYKAYWFTLYPKDEICSGLASLRNKSRKEAVVQAINNFLIWYYKNKQL